MSEHAENRIRQYLGDLPGHRNIGTEIAYGDKYRSPGWKWRMYALDRGDLEAVLTELAELRQEVLQHRGICPECREHVSDCHC